MNVLHITPHLGGGVGKAHAALAETALTVSRRSVARHSYALLEPPRDIIYTDRLRAAGCVLHIEPDTPTLAALAAAADIVQIEWWNHPRIYSMLASNCLADVRLTAWVHISGLVAPLVPRALVELVDQTLFTSPCSFGAENLRAAMLARPEAFGVVNSGFGFEDYQRAPRAANAPLRFGYLGTLDFLKMHPDFFDYIDAAETDMRVHLWGRYDPEGCVARKAAAMVHPERIRFESYTDDPARALSSLDVFVYLLSPEHYGTAENALVEAMSLGAVPIVFANPAEAYIVKDGQTGYVVQSQAEFVSCIARLVREPQYLIALRSAAQAEVARHFNPRPSLLAFDSVYAHVMRLPKTRRDFAALGPDALSWFLSSLSASNKEETIGMRLLSHITSKGCLGHFRSCFPQDEHLLARARLTG